MRLAGVHGCLWLLFFALGAEAQTQVPRANTVRASRPASLRPRETAEMSEEIGPPIMTEREYYDPNESLAGESFFDETSLGSAACNFCGTLGGTGCGPFGAGCLNGLFVRGEYLLWRTQGMNLPPLVTTSPQGTARANAGVLGAPGTTILFGGDRVGDDERSGGRITLGWWIDPCQRLGIEFDYFGLADETTDFSSSSTGDPILARPFFDVTLGLESANLVAFPNLIRGTVIAEHRTSFQGAGVRVAYNLACGDGCGTSWWTGVPVSTGYRFDLIAGYRFLKLDDDVTVTEDEVSSDTANPGAFFIRDRFETANQFHGADLGTAWRFCKGAWTADVLQKVALGNTHSVTTIGGSTLLTVGGQTQSFATGLLAQRTNSGQFVGDDFAIVPEFGANVGYHLNSCWRLTAGYNFIYWSRLARAGEQIDTGLNPNLLAPENPVVTSNLRPEFNLIYTDFWAHGLSLGVEGSW